MIKTITISPPPIADFVVPAICLGNTSSFTNTSSVSSATSLKFSWNFDDPSSGTANSSDLKHPSHLYKLPGTYQVSLTVTAPGGCRSTKVLPVLINDLP